MRTEGGREAMPGQAGDGDGDAAARLISSEMVRKTLHSTSVI